MCSSPCKAAACAPATPCPHDVTQGPGLTGKGFALRHQAQIRASPGVSASDHGGKTKPSPSHGPLTSPRSISQAFPGEAPKATLQKEAPGARIGMGNCCRNHTWSSHGWLSWGDSPIPPPHVMGLTLHTHLLSQKESQWAPRVPPHKSRGRHPSLPHKRLPTAVPGQPPSPRPFCPHGRGGLWGASFLCTRWCLVRWCFCTKHFPHWAQGWGFSPVWWRWCLARLGFWLKLFPHCPHW